MSGSTVTIRTIGYQGLSLGQFLELLKANGVEHLVDIREAPISRKVGFAKAALSEAVERAGIRYSHVRALGCPKPIRDRHKETGDWVRYTRDFKIYLAGQDEALAQLRATVAAARTCLLCYEADHNRCHRTFVAEAISSPGDELRHIAVKPPSPQSELTFA
jgi:uncharacterized protein (DUF488 family)